MTALFVIGAVLCLLVAVICVGAGLIKQPPNDITLVALALVELYLIVYAIIYIFASVSGNSSRGPRWEFWGYVVTALVLPIGAAYWALMDRQPVDNFIMAATAIVIVIMVYRMEQIWHFM